MQQENERRPRAPPEPDPAKVQVSDGERVQLLELATRLAEPELDVGSRLDLVDRLRRMLNHDQPQKK